MANLGQLVTTFGADMKPLDAAIEAQRLKLSSFQNNIGSSWINTWGKMTAQVWVAYEAVKTFTNFLKTGIEAVDRFNLTGVQLASMMTGMMKADNRTLPERYKEAREYATELLKELEKIDKQTLLGAEDLATITQEMMKQGVIIDINNEKEKQAFTTYANALATVTAGVPNKMIQLRQETRALLQGEVNQYSMLASMINAQTGDLKTQVELHKKQGDLWQWLAQQLQGFAAAQDEINMSWEAISSSMETTYTQILRAGMQVAYKDIIALCQKLNDLVNENKDIIISIANDGWMVIKETATEVYNIFRDISPLLELLGKSTMSILYGWESILALIPDLRKGFSDIVERMMLSSGAWVELIKGNKDAAKYLSTQAWESMFGKGERTADATLTRINKRLKELWGIEAPAKTGEKTTGTATKPTLSLPGTAADTAKMQKVIDQFEIWKRQIDMLDPSLSDLDKQLIGIQEDAERMLKAGISATDVKVQKERAEGYAILANQIKKANEAVKEYERIYRAQVEYEKAINEKRAEGIEKQLVAEDYWIEEMKLRLKDFVATEEEYEQRVLEITAIAEEKKKDIIEKNNNEIAILNNQYYRSMLDIAEAEMSMSRADVVKGRVEAIKEAIKYQTEYLALLTAGTPEWYQQRQAIIDLNKELAGLIPTLKEYTGNFVEGMEYAAQYARYNLPTDFQYGVDAINDMTSGLKDTFSSVFTDLRENQLKSFGDYVGDLCDRISDKWIDMLAEMLANWVMYGSMIQGGTARGGLTGLISGIGGFFGGLFSGGSAAAATATTGGGGIFGVGPVMMAQHGADFYTRGVTPIIAGEAGMEHVQITPLSREKNIDNKVEVNPNIRIINVLDPSIVGDYLATSEGEKMIMNIVQRN